VCGRITLECRPAVTGFHNGYDDAVLLSPFTTFSTVILPSASKYGCTITNLFDVTILSGKRLSHLQGST
jgi:hypothetical protein